MITSAQIRAARALLRWSSNDLANASGVGGATIRRLEVQDGVPGVQVKTLQAIQAALEAAGIEFLGSPEDCPGVRIKSSAANRDGPH